MVIALAVAIASSGSLDAAAAVSWRWHAGTSTPVASGLPVAPPPVHLLPHVSRFFALLDGYVAMDGAKTMTFPAWVVLNGAADPTLVAAMAELYFWHHRAVAR